MEQQKDTRGVVFPRAPGLKWRGRRSYWVAPEKAVAMGYKPSIVRIFFDGWESNPLIAAAMVAHCERLHTEALIFAGALNTAVDHFDGTFGTLIRRYLTDPESSYRRLKPSSLYPYKVYAPVLGQHIGAVRVDLTDGRDVQRWFKAWAGVDHLRHPDAKLPRARTMLAVLKAAVSFGVICRLPGCADFSAILSELEFPTKNPRTFAPTAAQVEAIRGAAHAHGAPSRALAYALQYETTLRQWDVTGIYAPLSDPRPSAYIFRGQKWIGPTWGMVDGMVLQLAFGKTEDTSALRGTYDLAACPMVVEELRCMTRPRVGPLIINERTAMPYWDGQFERGWKADFAAAGMPPKMWNRDLRAGALTEAGLVRADRADMRKIAGHTTDRQINNVYDRNTLEAHRRVMAARVAARKPK